MILVLKNILYSWQQKVIIYDMLANILSFQLSFVYIGLETEYLGVLNYSLYCKEYNN